jgi:hypothetical protein
MIVHALRFAFREGTTDEQRARVLELMRTTSSLESVTFGSVGQSIGDPSAGYTHAYCVGFEDLAALERYLYDPVHLAGDPEIVPHFAKLHVGPELSDDMDPELGAKIAAMHDRKMATVPDFAQLMNSIPEVRFG